MFLFICKAKLAPECMGFEELPNKKNLVGKTMCFRCRRLFDNARRKKRHQQVKDAQG